ncbi:MAG: hypothetical protein IJ192_13835 [Clostridia bacterium]|nr:hypothetical protein [Clostridia bacterium]
MPVLGSTDNCIVASAAEGDREIVRSGSCGENVTYTLDSEGLLIISGSGDMYDYDRSDYDQSPFYHDINQIVIEDGVTNIGESAFKYCSLISITIPDLVASF